MSKELRQIVKELVSNGYTVVQGRTHHLVRGHDGRGTLASLPTSPGRGRWEKNLRSELRRSGLLR